MASSQAILTDVDLRYRNTFTTSQKLVWFNEEQRELFDVLELDSPPYAFVTVADQNYYPFPDQFDVTKIKTATYQINTSPAPSWVELDFYRNDDRVSPSTYPFYTIVSNTLFLYVGDTTPADRTVYIYTDSDPTEVTTANLTSSPDLPTKYQEILKIGILKRITAARKDVQMQSNYDADYQEKIADVLWQRRMKEPEWNSPVDFMPYRPQDTRGSGRWNWPMTSP